MSNEPKKETTLRRSFAMQKPVVLARNETVAVMIRPLANAYFNGEVTKFEGKVISAGKEAVNVQTPGKMAMYAAEKGGYSSLASGQNETVRVDEQKISRLNANVNIAALSRSNSYS